MKYSIALLSAVGAAVAQDLASLPACGQTCISNMVAIATGSFGCGAGDVNCFCSKMDFGYGVRDCSNEACESAEEAAQVISYGTNYCAQALGDAASTAGAPALSVLSSALTDAGAAPTPTPTGDDEGEGAQSTPITTSPLAVTTVVDGQTQVQTTGFVTLFGPAGDAASSALSSASDAISSAASVVSSISDEVNPTSSSGETEPTTTGGAEGGEESSAPPNGGNDQGAAPMITAAPVIGAGALAAALFLL